MRKPSKRRRLIAAHFRAESALGLFTKAADELDAVADAALAVAVEATDEIEELTDLRNDAQDQASLARVKARNIRELVK